MLRPSAFQNSQNGSGLGSSSTESSSKSILRPSSFQLAGSKFQLNKNEAESTSAGTLSSSPTATPTNEEKISSTTNNIEDSNDGDEVNKINPFNSSKLANVDDDGDDSDSESKKKERHATTSGITSTSSLGGSGLFQPVTSASTTTTTTTNLFAAATRPAPIRNGSESNNIDFVFGQNIHERTMGASEASSTDNPEDKKKEENDAECSSSQLFAAAVASSAAASSSTTSFVAQNSSDKENSTKENSRVEDLTKVAREYEESRVQKRKYDEVQTITGEEDETNVFDVNCKLFAFIASNWEERGPGSLRLNDQKTGSTWKSSRVVFRTSGNLRVLINTKVWPGMVVEKSGQKSLRLTAIDSNDGQVKIFLAMARPDDISSLYTALKKRIDLEKEKDEEKEEQPAAEPEPGSNEAEASDNGEKDGANNEPSLKREKKD